jgi:succinate dehydrogenase / fumarate reductase, iron-sulfur subunit
LDVDLRIKRFDPETDRRPHWEEYRVTVDESDRVLDALHQVRWYQDGSLAFRRSCAHGVCGSDAMVVNGENRLACVLLVRDVGPKITVEPLRGLPVLKDLVVDMDAFFAQYRKVMPWLVNEADPGEGERLQSPEERARFDDTTKCILCAACTTSCPIYWANDTYVGPAAIVNAHRFIFDSRDQAGEQRLEILDEQSGVWKCRTAFNCTDACPRGIKVTEAIQDVKRAIVRPGKNPEI